MIVSSQKPLRQFFQGVIFFAIVGCISCKKKETTPPTFTISGNWRVSYYYKANVNRTNDFDGYSFVFNSDSTLTANHNNISEIGSWTYNSSTIQFVITFGATVPLTEISKNWLLILKSDSELIFDEDSTVNDEELHFQKI